MPVFFPYISPFDAVLGIAAFYAVFFTALAAKCHKICLNVTNIFYSFGISTP
jgi:hypothetical protein